MMKKIFALLLALALTLSLAACGSSPATSQADGETPANDATEKEIVDVVMGFFYLGGNLSDTELVLEEINKIANEKYGINIKLLSSNSGTYDDVINLMLSSGEQLDIFMNFSSDALLRYYSQGHLLDIKPYLETQGQGIVEALGDEVWLECYNIEGDHILGVPSIRDLALSKGFSADKALVEKYDLPVPTSEYTPMNDTPYETFEEMLKVIKENEPDIIPYNGYWVTTQPPIKELAPIDPLGDYFGVLMNYGTDNLEVVNLYETDYYRDTALMYERWYEEGYISPDVLTNAADVRSMFTAGRAFSHVSGLKPGINVKDSQVLNREILSYPMSEARRNSSTVTSVSWFVNANSEVPEEAVTLLNALYSDPEIFNLFSWGIEGMHYDFNEDGTIGLPEGVTAETVGYSPNLSWMFGNEYMSHVWEGNPIDLYDQLREFNDNSLTSKAFGFVYNPENVTSEVAACNNVVAQYAPGIEHGLVDIDEVLPEFIAELKEAGIDTIIAEKQAQLDAWVAANNVE